MRRLCAALVSALALAGCATSGLSGLPPEQQATARHVEIYLDGVTGLQGRFLQTGPEEGAMSGGRFIFTPGQLRLAYDTPHVMHLVAGDGRIVMTDEVSGAVTRLSLARNPLGLFLRVPFHFNNGIQVTSVQETASVVQLSASQADNPSQGRLTLQFAKDGAGGLRLIGLDGVDARDHHVQLRFYDVQPVSSG